MTEKINDLSELKKLGLYIIDEDEILVTNKLTKVLKKKGLSPTDLAKATGLSRQNINAVIRSNMKPGVDFVLKVSFALNMKVEELFSLTPAAWIVQAKDLMDSSIYIDLVNMEIINNAERKARIKKDKMEYFHVESNELFPQKKYLSMQEEYVAERAEKREAHIAQMRPDTPKPSVKAQAASELRSEFAQSYTSIYKRLGQKLDPYVITGK